MRQATMTAAALTGVLVLAHALVGFRAAYQWGYGAMVLMGLAIALTFLWLWCRRATPLALGMAFSWAGAAGVLGWWWSYGAAGRPEWMAEAPALFGPLGFYMAGAVLHFATIAVSLGLPRWTTVLPVAGAFGLSALAGLFL